MITRSLSKRKSLSNSINRFSYTINLNSSIAEMAIGAIPFNLYGIEDESLTLTVDWGDGFKSTLTPASYPTLYADVSSGSFPEYIHSYEHRGIYTISLDCSDWSQIHFQIYSTEEISNNEFSANFNLNILRKCVISINSPIPPVTGKMWITIPYGQTSYNPYKSDNYISDVFCYYQNLTSVPNNLFVNLPSIGSVSNIFKYCYNLTNIPSGLFNGLTSSVYDAYGAFLGCENILTIPTGLLDPLTGLEEPTYMFSETGITSIPENLFALNTAIYDISNIFNGCSALVSIPENLFINNTDLQYAYAAFSGTGISDFTLDLHNSPSIEDVDEFCDADSSGSATRIIKVPADSTTYTSFSGIASDLNLTIQTV